MQNFFTAISPGELLFDFGTSFAALLICWMGAFLGAALRKHRTTLAFLGCVGFILASRLMFPETPGSKCDVSQPKTGWIGGVYHLPRPSVMDAIIRITSES